MAYRAIRNFRHNKWIVKIGEFYLGEDIDKLLNLKLIEHIIDEISTPLTEQGAAKIMDELPASAAPKPKRKKKS